MEAIDLAFNLNPQALAVLHQFRRLELEFLSEGKADPDLKTFPWYDGRERGICLAYTPTLGKDYIYVVFAEHRGSDGIFVGFWKTPRRLLNPPTPADIPEAVYSSRRVFSFAAIGEVVDHIYALLEAHHREHVPRQGMSLTVTHEIVPNHMDPTCGQLKAQILMNDKPGQTVVILSGPIADIREFVAGEIDQAEIERRWSRRQR